jgi:hypothetical protein
MSKTPRVIVLGMMGRTPFAGVAWQVLHYLEGFRRLGCDVYYVEDTGDWSYDPEQNTITDDHRYTVNYIARLMDWCGSPDRWAYRSGANGGIFGLSESAVSDLYERADVLVNLTGATVLREEHLRVPVRIYLETDPFLPQIEVARGSRFTVDLLGDHTHHFTYGENLSTPYCDVPVVGFDYHHTRQPVVPEWWASPNLLRSPSSTSRFTTISSWQQSGKDIEWNGETYLWSKHAEFLKFIDLPRHAEQPFEIALASRDAEVIGLLADYGWRVVDAFTLSLDILPYRDYIVGSRGEFTVAKDQYVRPRTGWFSDRSACYLAAGRPVITQDTGFGRFLPTGKGLFAFETMEDILGAVEEIVGDYEGNCHAAREIVAEYFAAEKVLGALLEEAGL